MKKFNFKSYIQFIISYMKNCNNENKIDNDLDIDDSENENKIDDSVKDELNYLPSYQSYIKQYSSINEF